MNCIKCDVALPEGARFCQNCGLESARSSGKIDELKNYQPAFYRQVLLGILLAIVAPFFIGMPDVIRIFAFLYVASCCVLVYKAMRSIGKKNWWWTLGLFSIIPLGFLVPYFVVKKKLIPHGMWSGSALKK